MALKEKRSGGGGRFSMQEAEQTTIKPPATKKNTADMRIQPTHNHPARRRRNREQELKLHEFSSRKIDPASSAAGRERRARQKPVEPQEGKTKRKKKIFFMRILLLLVIVAAVGLLAYLLMRVEEIEVSGIYWYDAQEVIELSQIEKGDSVLKLNEAGIKQNIEKNPHYIVEDIKYSFPTKVTIVVTERPEAACFAFANTYVIIDPEGLILGHVEKSQGTLLPIVNGLEVTEFVLGAQIRTTDTYKQDVLRKVLNALCGQNMQNEVESIDISNVNQIWMQLREDGTKVCLGQGTELEEKFQWLQKIIETIWQKGYTGGTIDLTSVTAPVYIPPAQNGNAEQAENAE